MSADTLFAARCSARVATRTTGRAQKFCVGCGSGLAPACPSFGAAYHTGDAFCAEWGRALRDAPAPVPAALERAEAADARREPDVVAAGA